MADIELVIKIPEEEYELCEKQYDTECLDVLMIAVKYGTPLPKGHGRLIDGDALYDQYRYADYDFDKTMEYAPTIIEAESEEQGMIFKYTFEDGTILRVLDAGLSLAEIRKLEELHGKCNVESEDKE